MNFNQDVFVHSYLSYLEEEAEYDVEIKLVSDQLIITYHWVLQELTTLLEGFRFCSEDEDINIQSILIKCEEFPNDDKDAEEALEEFENEFDIKVTIEEMPQSEWEDRKLLPKALVNNHHFYSTQYPDSDCFYIDIDYDEEHQTTEVLY